MQIFLREGPLSFFPLKFPVLLIAIIGFIKGVAGICQDHVDEFFVEGSVEVQFEILAEGLVGPECSENFIGVLPVLELLVELVRSAGVGNAAVEPDQPES